MGVTKIQWTAKSRDDGTFAPGYTFNPWRGCVKVSPGCTNCYAEAMSRRNPAVLGKWGAAGTRVVAAESYWRMPLRWDAEAGAAGERRLVFCASLADVFEDRPELAGPRRRLFRLIAQTPSLDWLLLTKRPENIGRLWPVGSDLAGPGADEWPNVWLGTSVEDRKHGLPRVGVLREIPAAVRFLSAEPLLEDLGPIDLAGIDWVIVGGESGPGARPFGLGWARSIRDQCRAAGAACFVKQLGSDPRDPAEGPERRMGLRDKKGGKIAEFPADLRLREFPQPAVVVG